MVSWKRWALAQHCQQEAAVLRNLKPTETRDEDRRVVMNRSAAESSKRKNTQPPDGEQKTQPDKYQSGIRIKPTDRGQKTEVSNQPIIIDPSIGSRYLILLLMKYKSEQQKLLLLFTEKSMIVWMFINHSHYSDLIFSRCFSR